MANPFDRPRGFIPTFDRRPPPRVPRYSGGGSGGGNGGVPPAPVVNGVSQPPEAIIATVSAAFAPIALRYGRVTAGARILSRCVYQGKLVLACAWGRGPIDAIESLLIDDAPPPDGVTATHHLGDQSTPDATLIAAFAAQTPARVYADVMAGIAYSVVMIPPGLTKGFPRITAVLRGLKVFDPRARNFQLDGTIGKHATASTAAGNQVNGATVLECEYFGALDSWAASALARTLVSKWREGAGQACATFEITAAGAIRFTWSTDGTTLLSFDCTAPAPFSAGQAGGLKIAVNLASGGNRTATFYSSPQGLIWTQLGASVTTVGASSIFDDGVGKWQVGGRSAGAVLLNAIGRSHRARVRLAGTEIVRLDMSAVAVGANTWVSATGETWTLAGGITVMDDIVRWSDNAALALADFVSSSAYGWGRVVNWPSATETANCDDELIGATPERRRLIGLSLERPAPVNSWVEALRAYAGCFVSDLGGEVFLVPDKPRSAGAIALDATNSSLMTLTKRGRMDLPTVVVIAYTDTTEQPWREKRSNPAMAPGVLTGETPWRESLVRLEGIQRFSQAGREATERLNKLRLRDVAGDWRVKDVGLRLSHGDVVPVTHAVGLTAKAMLVLAYSLDSLGRWVAQLLEHDNACFSDAVIAEPTTGDTGLPDPTDPPQPAALALVEEVFQYQSFGQFGSRIKISITPPANWPYTAGFDVEVMDDNVPVHLSSIATTSSPVDRTGPMQEGRTYLVHVYTRSSTGHRSPARTESIAVLGKYLIPSDVPGITQAFEVGGIVLFTILPAIDVDTLRYEWRYYPNGTGSWATATFLDLVDGLRPQFRGLPVGTHRFYVKARDSVGQLSANAVYADVTITSDADAFLQSREFVNPNLTGANLAEYPSVEGVWKKRWATSVASDSWNAVMPDPLTSGANPVISYHANATSKFVGESWDLGAETVADWTLEATVTVLSGAVSYYIETSPDGSTWTRQPGLGWSGATRFIRPVIEALTSSTFILEAPPKISFAAESRLESGVITTSASGGTLVDLSGAYAAVQDLQLTAINTTASRTCVADRILVHPQAGLLCKWDRPTAGSNNFAVDISYVAYVIVNGDYFEYEVFIDPATPAAVVHGDGGFGLFTAAGATSLGGLLDADGHAMNLSGVTAFDPLARGVWKKRRFLLNAYAGQTTSHWRTLGLSQGIGAHKHLYRNVRITDTAGTTVRVSVYGSSGEPTVHGDVGSATNYQMGPANSFLAYGFNPATGAQVATDARYSFRGV